MKKIISMISCLVITFSLVGCRDNTESLMPSETIETVQEMQNTILEISEISQIESDTENDEQELDSSGDEVKVLSDDEIEEAKQAALDYYANTVLEVNTMNYIEVGSRIFADGDCNFSVNISIVEVVKEPDRTISKKRMALHGKL
jgi:negative regulator of sigma E activity